LEASSISACWYNVSNLCGRGRPFSPLGVCEELPATSAVVSSELSAPAFWTRKYPLPELTLLLECRDGCAETAYAVVREGDDTAITEPIRSDGGLPSIGDANIRRLVGVVGIPSLIEICKTLPGRRDDGIVPWPPVSGPLGGGASTNGITSSP